MHISGSAALVTGGASGLGLACVQALAAAGAHVVSYDLPASRAGAQAPPDGVLLADGDVTDEAAVEAAVALAAAQGPLRIVVNCAGISRQQRLLDDGDGLTTELFTRLVQINLIGTFTVTRQAVRAMAQTEPVDGERGVVVNTASIASYEGQIGSVAYAASKAGVAGMTLPLARELAEHLIRVVAIAPGPFETRMFAGLAEEYKDSLGAQIPHPSRLGRPAEFGALAQHLIENPMLNGEVIRLDGALRMGPR
ncbi:SDR family NAD(P)-dependent oxidoreductase [Jatrophihabitans sp.]|uniref:SDR family NAD(P)-dependent oxidoreductase n=1 Tax=Jatrophihabitans sp. TaxID=1932789 RepID=UPI0030C741D2|nr:3-hydroxyacyl-CoA dehydrogenase [Jatrophihabitans sp.]